MEGAIRWLVRRKRELAAALERCLAEQRHDHEIGYGRAVDAERSSPSSRASIGRLSILRARGGKVVLLSLLAVLDDVVSELAHEGELELEGHGVALLDAQDVGRHSLQQLWARRADGRVSRGQRGMRGSGLRGAPLIRAPRADHCRTGAGVSYW